MLEAINNIEEFTSGISKDLLFADKMRYFAVVKNVEIIGEAANMLTNEFRESHTELPWRAIVGMRNVIVHDYVNIHKDLLWSTIQEDVPSLKNQISIYLEEF